MLRSNGYHVYIYESGKRTREAEKAAEAEVAW
jgi:hypothetical protein